MIPSAISTSAAVRSGEFSEAMRALVMRRVMGEESGMDQCRVLGYGEYRFPAVEMSKDKLLPFFPQGKAVKNPHESVIT